jgi:HD-GYP domain-containing protein (c-di-GMP phosphodiesterase class II)
VAVCDAFNAMTSNRPYSPGMTVDEALAELQRCAGSQFDQIVVDAFCAEFRRRERADVRPAAAEPLAAAVG